MIKIWSELPVTRMKEQVADLATLLWVVFWGNIVWQLFQFLAGFAEAGRAVQAGGEGMVQGGRDLGESLAGLPLVGSQVRDIARDAFAGAGQPLSDFGTQLEQFIFVVAIVLALLLALVTLGAVADPLSPLALGSVAARAGRPPWRSARPPRHRGRLRRAHPGDAGRHPARLLDPARVHARSARRLDRPAATTGWPGRSSPAWGCGLEGICQQLASTGQARPHGQELSINSALGRRRTETMRRTPSVPTEYRPRLQRR